MDKMKQTLELRDIHLGEPNIWPLAPGWWLLLVAFVVALYFISKHLLKLKKQKQLNVLMLQELENIKSQYNKHKNKNDLAADISELLKRFVRHVLKDSNATSLTGKDWIDYLNTKANGEVFNQFSHELTQAQYLPKADFDTHSLIATVKNYFPTAIKAHFKGAKDA